jgi:hypothetical protein
VVILSKAFFAKEWPLRELNALIGRETSSRKVILPIWHEIDRADVQRFSPLLVDKIAIRSSEGLDNVVKAILRAFGATNSRGVFRVFSYNADHVKRQQYMGLEYLSLTAGGDRASVELHFSYNKEFDANIHGKQLHDLADEFWEPALRIMCSLAGWQYDDIVIGRPQMQLDGFSIRRSIDAPSVPFDEWKGYTALLHLRNYQSGRSIDSDYLDLYFVPIKNPFSDNYEEVLREQPVVDRLTGITSELGEPLARIGHAALGESGTGDINVRPPIFDRDCVPVWGGDAYWFKAMLK